MIQGSFFYQLWHPTFELNFLLSNQNQIIMRQLKNLKDLFAENVQRLHEGDSKQIESLPQLRDQIETKELQALVDREITNATNRKEVLDEIINKLEIELDEQRPNHPVEETFRYASQIAENSEKGIIRDAAIANPLQQLCLFDNAECEAIRSYAQTLGFEDIAEKMEHFVEEERQIQQELTRLSENQLNNNQVRQLRNLNDLFAENVQRQYQGDLQQVESLPQLKEQINSKELQALVDRELTHANNRKEALEQIINRLELELDPPRRNHPVEETFRYASQLAQNSENEVVRDAAIANPLHQLSLQDNAECEAIRSYAETLGFQDIANQMKNFVEEGRQIHQELNRLAENQLKNNQEHLER